MADPPNLDRIEAFAFDFDGVILESAAIKTQAFATLFQDVPQQLPRILAFHDEHRGRSRFEKFQWIYSELLGKDLSDEESQQLGNRFSELVASKMLGCPFVPGALELLERLHRRFPIFVVSGTPQGELELLVRERSIAHLFEEVHGSPATKEKILSSLLERHGLAADRLLMIGDGRSDYLAARAVGAMFIARGTPGDETTWADVDLRVVDSLSELDRLLAEPGSSSNGD